MNNHFLTISEALKLLNNNKSYSSLNRLVHKLKSDKNTKHLIKTIKGKNLISEQYLKETFSDFITMVISSDDTVNHTPEVLTTIEILQNQLVIKDKQINDMSKKLDVKEEKERELTATIIKLSTDIAALRANNDSGEKSVINGLITIKEKEEKLKRIFEDIDNSSFFDKLKFLFGKRDKPYHDDILK